MLPSKIPIAFLEHVFRASSGPADLRAAETLGWRTQGKVCELLRETWVKLGQLDEFRYVKH